MSILTNTTDTRPIVPRRSIRRFARRFVRLINSFVAAFIAQREHQASRNMLRLLSDRELRDIGLARSQISGGLTEAAKERALFQRSLAQRRSTERWR